MEPEITTAAAIDLSQFCAREEGKYLRKRPWVSGGWRYATDGRVCLRMPAPGEPDTQPEHEREEFLPAADVFAKNAVDWQKDRVADWPQPFQCVTGPGNETRPCLACNGKGMRSDAPCGKCSGTGEKECEHCGSEVECTHCDGYGFLGDRQPCVVCDGAGEWPYESLRVGEHLIGAYYHALISTLPNIRYAVGRMRNDAKGDYAPLPFIFDGGEGLIMPQHEHGDVPKE